MPKSVQDVAAKGVPFIEKKKRYVSKCWSLKACVLLRENATWSLKRVFDREKTPRVKEVVSKRICFIERNVTCERTGRSKRAFYREKTSRAKVLVAKSLCFIERKRHATESGD